MWVEQARLLLIRQTTDPVHWREECDLCGDTVRWAVVAGWVFDGQIVPIVVCLACLPPADVPPEEM